MEKKTISQLRELKPSNSQYLCRLLTKSVTEKTGKTGRPFLSVELGDKTGTFIFICFEDNPCFKAFKRLPNGSILDCHVFVDRFNDQFTLRISFINQLDTSDPTVFDDVVETPKESIDDLWKAVVDITDTISDPKIKSLIKYTLVTLSSDFKNHPAGRSVHHAYKGGLLEHTANMLRIASRTIDLYPELNRDLVLAGIVLHDLGKIREYNFVFSPEETFPGQLKGHVLLGLDILREANNVTPIDPKDLLSLEHIICSHMGKLEWGASVVPATLEAVFVATIDMMDAKTNAAQYAYRNTPSESLSGYTRGLDTRLVKL